MTIKEANELFKNSVCDAMYIRRTGANWFLRLTGWSVDVLDDVGNVSPLAFDGLSRWCGDDDGYVCDMDDVFADDYDVMDKQEAAEIFAENNAKRVNFYIW